MFMQKPLLLFVCTGNICRSPMAEFLLRSQLPAECSWRVESAGTSAAPGMPASAGAIEVMAEMEIDIRAHRSRPLTEALVREAEVIVAMTRDHRDTILDHFPIAARRIFLLGSFAPVSGEREISDPFGGSVQIYRLCRDTIASTIPGVVDFLSERSSERQP